MPLVKGSQAYLRKLERDRGRKRKRSGRKLKSGEVREPRKRADPPGANERTKELAGRMMAWTNAPGGEAASGWTCGPFRVIHGMKAGPRGASSM